MGATVHLTRLQVAGLRCLAQVELVPGPGLNLITGGNGAGKSSLLEAVHVLGYGRSFRGRVRDGLVRTGCDAVELFAEWRDAQDRPHRAGLRHAGARWEARLDGEPVATLGELCMALAVVTFDPGSHELVNGPAEHRRRYLDWGLFHVEPSFHAHWRRYARALKQRNALLKSRPAPAALAPWERELDEAGEAITGMRQAYLEAVEPFLAAAAADYLPELGALHLDFQPGWRRRDFGLGDALLLARERDLATGYTSVGPHRADWSLAYAALPGREALSRGQAKLTALACVLGQARAYAATHGDWPVVCLDDLASELDAPHQARVLGDLLASPAQVLLTGTERPPGLPVEAWNGVAFHVEHGQLSPTGTLVAGG